MNPGAIFIIPGLMVIAVFCLMAMFARLYRKAGPHEALVVYGFRGTRIIKGRGSVISRWWRIAAYFRWS
jgi:flotillin